MAKRCFLNSLLLLAVLFTAAPVDGQVITISEDISVKREDAYKVIGKFGDRILLYKIDGNSHEVITYSEEMLQRSEHMLDFEKMNADIIALMPGDSTFHIIYGYKYKGDYFVKHHEYNPKIQLVDSVTLEVIPKMYFTPQFIAVGSEDDSKVLLIRTDRESDISCKSYDLQNKKTLWDKDLIFDGVSYRQDYRQAIVTNEGDMYLIMDHEKNSRRYKEFIVISVDRITGAIKRKNLNLDDLAAHDIYATYDNLNDQLIVSGLYNEKLNGKSLGLYLFELNGRTRGVKLHTIDFDSDMLEEVHGKPVSDDKGVSDFQVEDIVLRQDGGMVIFAEMQKEYSRRPNVPVRSTDLGPAGWVDYYFEDVMVFSIHPDGELHWHTLLHKKQYSQDDDGMYSSFFVFQTPEKVRLLYNDEIRHESTVSEYVVRGNGYHKRNSVFSTDYQRLGLRFRDAVQVGYYECIIPSERNNKLNLVRIRYDDSSD